MVSDSSGFILNTNGSEEDKMLKSSEHDYYFVLRDDGSLAVNVGNNFEKRHELWSSEPNSYGGEENGPFTLYF